MAGEALALVPVLVIAKLRRGGAVGVCFHAQPVRGVAHWELMHERFAGPEIRIFLMSDATVLGLPNQVEATGNGLQGMVEQLVAQDVEFRVCRTCALARGLAELPLIAGVTIGTLVELAEATLAADKVITF